MAESIEGMSYAELRQRARELACAEHAERAIIAAADGLLAWYDRHSAARRCSAHRRERARIERRLARMEGN